MGDRTKIEWVVALARSRDHATNLVYRVGKARAGRLLDGAVHDGIPEVSHA